MKNSRPEIKSLINTEDASLYYQKGSKLKKEKKWANPSYKWAGAGYRTTPSDLVMMTNAYTEGMIKNEVVEDMFRALKLAGGSQTHVGVGWRTNVDPIGREWRDHAGNWQGARSVLAYNPKENLSISIMVNCQWNGFIEETAHVIAAILNSDETKQPLTLQKEISALFVNSEGEKFTYTGTVSLEKGQGALKSNSEGFLKNMPLFYLGYDQHYAAITPYGVMYMKIDSESTGIIGKLYMYGSMRDGKPTDENASVAVSLR